MSSLRYVLLKSVAVATEIYIKLFAQLVNIRTEVLSFHIAPLSLCCDTYIIQAHIHTH